MFMDHGREHFGLCVHILSDRSTQFTGLFKQASWASWASKYWLCSSGMPTVHVFALTLVTPAATSCFCNGAQNICAYTVWHGRSVLSICRNCKLASLPVSGQGSSTHIATVLPCGLAQQKCVLQDRLAFYDEEEEQRRGSRIRVGRHHHSMPQPSEGIDLQSQVARLLLHRL